MNNKFNPETLRRNMERIEPSVLDKGILPTNRPIEKYICKQCHRPYLGYDYGLCDKCDCVESGIKTDTLFIISDCFSYANGKPEQFSGYYTLICNDRFDIEDEFNIEKSLYKAFNGTTNNYGELRGVLDGLIEFVNGEDFQIKSWCKNIIVVSDSEYVIKGAGERMWKWKEKGWKNSSGEVKNLDLWKKLMEVVITIKRDLNINIVFKHQKGHVDKNRTKQEDPLVYLQEMCDTKAVEIKEKIRVKKGI